MTPPVVSVVMSVYNGEEFLAEAVESILGQTFTDFEFIIVNDGSTDGTAQILAGFAQRDGRIRILSQENRGRAESLNRAIAEATAALIARMDADDIALPNRLTEQVAFMGGHPEVGLLGAGIELMSSDGRRVDEYLPPEKDEEIRSALGRGNPFRHPTILMRKATVLEAGGYRKPLLDADDYDLWLRMSELTKMANLRQTLVRYRLHASQVTVSNMTHQVLCCWVARASAAARRNGKRDPVDEAEAVTPELAAEVGVDMAGVQNEVVAAHLHWIRVFGTFRPDAALAMVDRLMGLFDLGAVDRPAAADALIMAARIHLRSGRIGKALSTAGRAALLEPLALGRAGRMAAARRGRNLKRLIQH